MSAGKMRIIKKIKLYSKKARPAEICISKPKTAVQPAAKQPQSEDRIEKVSLDQGELDALFKNHTPPSPKEEPSISIGLSQNELDLLYKGHVDPASAPSSKKEPEVKEHKYTFSDESNADVSLSQNELDALFKNHSIEGKPGADGKTTVIDYDPKRLLTPSFSVHKSPEDEKILDQNQIDMLLVEYRTTNKMDPKDLNQDEIDALLATFSKEKAFEVKKES